jgi:hypothetical protein
LCFLVSVPPLIAQVAVPRTPADAKVPVTVALQVGGEALKFSSPGMCRHAAQAGIYDLAAEQWSVQASDATRNVTLTLWQPKGAGSMVSLAVGTGGKTHVVDTVKVGTRGTVRGSGAVKLAPAGSGGTFTVDGTAADGAKITGTIRCDAFLAPAPAGG